MSESQPLMVDRAVQAPWRQLLALESSILRPFKLVFREASRILHFKNTLCFSSAGDELRCVDLFFDYLRHLRLPGRESQLQYAIFIIGASSYAAMQPIFALAFTRYLVSVWGIQIPQLDIKILPDAFGEKFPVTMFAEALQGVKGVEKVTVSGLEDELEVKLVEEAALGNRRNE